MSIAAMHFDIQLTRLRSIPTLPTSEPSSQMDAGIGIALTGELPMPSLSTIE